MCMEASHSSHPIAQSEIIVPNVVHWRGGGLCSATEAVRTFP